MSRLLTGAANVGPLVPSLNLSEAEAAVAAIPSQRGWWEADSGYSSDLGGRWYDKRFGVGAYVYNALPPVHEESGGLSRLRFGYSPGVAFAGTDRGALVPAIDHDLLSASGFTVVSVTRVPTVASGESATVGGNVWSSRGPSGNTLPGLNISGSTGRPVFRAGGAVMSNPSAVDLRDGTVHIIRCTYDAVAGTISINVDRGLISASSAGATTPPDTAQPGMLAPAIGASLSNADPPALSSPFYGQIYALLPFNAPLGAGGAAVVDGYLAAKYGVTLV